MILYFLKSFHIVGFVAWFAGLFYMVRIFVYHREALDQAEPDRQILSQQFDAMSTRVFKLICQPAMMFTWTCGIAMLVMNPGYFEQNWIFVKLFFLVLLTVYHTFCKKFVYHLEEEQDRFQAFHFRILNEFPTVFLLIIVVLAVFRDNVNYWYLSAGVVLFITMIGWGILAYRKKRKAEEQAMKSKS